MTEKQADKLPEKKAETILQISVKDPVGRSYVISAFPSDTMETVRAKLIHKMIESGECTDSSAAIGQLAKFKLFYATSGRTIDDGNRTVAEYGLCDPTPEMCDLDDEMNVRSTLPNMLHMVPVIPGGGPAFMGAPL